MVDIGPKGGYSNTICAPRPGTRTKRNREDEDRETKEKWKVNTRMENEALRIDKQDTLRNTHIAMQCGRRESESTADLLKKGWPETPRKASPCKGGRVPQ